MGGLAIAVSLELKGLEVAHERHGVLPCSQLVQVRCTAAPSQAFFSLYFQWSCCAFVHTQIPNIQTHLLLFCALAMACHVVSEDQHVVCRCVCMYRLLVALINTWYKVYATFKGVIAAQLPEKIAALMLSGNLLPLLTVCKVYDH